MNVKNANIRTNIINNKNNILRDAVFLRLGQLLVNELYKKGLFKVPIHLGLGHEAIAIAVDQVISNDDQLVLSHRNIHYHMARDKRVEFEIDEYLLKETGLAKGKLGSMNLVNPANNIIYTSNVLGNNLPVSCGLGLATKMNRDGVVFVVTGDGAIEEGSFYESLLLMKSLQLSNIIIIENNGWSLATQIHERRSAIDLSKLSSGLDIEYYCLEGNDVYKYVETLKKLRTKSIEQKNPICLEVMLTSLGSWYMEVEEYPNGKFINYHAGPSPILKFHESLIIEESNEDPLYVLLNKCEPFEIDAMVKEFYSKLSKKIQNELH
jgi:TPP-dependent pyruvate/acetoin dehydrogenase alpha subunit